jgi:hypothetical protein
MIQVGSRVIYRKPKHSLDPGPRAESINPAPHGDSYSYCVDKLWVVVGKEEPNRVVVQTRRGKRLTLDSNDPNLRPANWLDRLRYWGRFPKLEKQQLQAGPDHPIGQREGPGNASRSTG